VGIAPQVKSFSTEELTTRLFHGEVALPASIWPHVSNPAFRKWAIGKLWGLSVFDQAADFLDENGGIVEWLF